MTDHTPADAPLEADLSLIQRIIPHRYPFLLVDRVLSLVPGKSVRAIKNVTINEPFFQGHFPGKPVMPGVLIIEAMAQACAMLAFARMGGERDPEKLFYFASIDNARFKRVVIPGDQLRFECTFLREKLGMIKMHCDATVDGQLAACADMMCSYRSPK